METNASFCLLAYCNKEGLQKKNRLKNPVVKWGYQIGGYIFHCSVVATAWLYTIWTGNLAEIENQTKDLFYRHLNC